MSARSVCYVRTPDEYTVFTEGAAASIIGQTMAVRWDGADTGKTGTCVEATLLDQHTIKCLIEIGDSLN